MKNLEDQNNFKKKKQGNKLIREMVDRVGDNLLVTTQVTVPHKLIKDYSEKVKQETGRDLIQEKGELMVAEMIVNWVNNNLLNIENLGPEIVLGEDYQKNVQVQAQGQEQNGQEQQAQSAAQEIPAQEQGQGQAQQGQAQQGQGQQGQGQQGQGQQQTQQTQQTQQGQGGQI